MGVALFLGFFLLLLLGVPIAVSIAVPAFLVIWGGDPFDVNSAADQVILGGQLDPMKSRQTQLLERYLPIDAGLGRAYINP